MLYSVYNFCKDLNKKKINTQQDIHPSSSIIFEELGILLKRESIASVDADYTVLDIFMKIPIGTLWYQNQAGQPEPTCGTGHERKFLEIIEEDIIKAINLHGNFTEIQENFNGRGKRFLGGLIGGGLIGLAASTISALILNRDISQFKERFQNFAKAVTTFQGNQLTFNKNIVQILKKIHHNECAEELELTDLQARIAAVELRQELQHILQYISTYQQVS